MEEKFGIAIKCLLKNEYNKYLILKKTQEEAKNDASENLYDIPGGRMEYGEDIIDTLVREVFEETGIKLKLNQIEKILNAKSIIRKDGLNLVVITYIANVKNCSVKISSEHSEFYWIDKNFKDLPKWIIDIISMV
mgnify:CR=1 FL=1